MQKFYLADKEVLKLQITDQQFKRTTIGAANTTLKH